MADLYAEFKTTKQIHAACAEEGWGLSERQIFEYIAEVRRRWKEENSLPDITEKKAESINRLQAIYQKAAARVSYTETGDSYSNPDLWLMRQILLDILKIEGVLDHKDSSNGDLDAILDRLAQERAARGDSPGPH